MALRSLLTSSLLFASLSSGARIEDGALNDGLSFGLGHASLVEDAHQRPSRDLKFVSRNPKFKLSSCEGDCDSDRNCKEGLKCFQRPKFDPYRPVPTCSGKGKPGADYCFDDGSMKSNAFQGHPIALKKIPFRCDDEDCDVGGCVKGKTGQYMVRFEPVGTKYIWSNPSWGGLHVTMTSFSNYSDPMGKFEMLRERLAEHDTDWVPGGVVSKKKECKGEKSIRIDFESEYVDSVGMILGEIGFLAKRGSHKHISVEEGMDGASIVKDFQQEKAKWNIVLVTVFDDYIEKMATIKAKYTPR